MPDTCTGIVPGGRGALSILGQKQARKLRKHPAMGQPAETLSSGDPKTGKGGYMDKETPKPFGGTVDDAEIAKFAAMAEEWWDPEDRKSVV